MGNTNDGGGGGLSRFSQIQSQIHLHFNRQSVIYTTMINEHWREVKVQLRPKVETIAYLDGTCSTAVFIGNCVLCGCQIDIYKLIASMKDCLICYSCLQESKKTFLIERFFLLSEIDYLPLKELKGHLFSYLQSLMPHEMFKLFTLPEFYRDFICEKRMEMMSHIRHIYNDLSTLQMKLPSMTAERGNWTFLYRWRWSKARKIDIITLIFSPHDNQCEVVEVRDNFEYEREGSMSLFDALSRVKTRLNTSSF